MVEITTIQDERNGKTGTLTPPELHNLTAFFVSGRQGSCKLFNTLALNQVESGTNYH